MNYTLDLPNININEVKRIDGIVHNIRNLDVEIEEEIIVGSKFNQTNNNFVILFCM